MTICPPKKADYKIILSSVSKTEMIMHAGVWNATLKTANFVDSSTKNYPWKHIYGIRWDTAEGQERMFECGHGFSWTVSRI